MIQSVGIEGLVSIICLGYKHVDYIKENIFAIWQNNYKNIEIIAIDDGSNDGSVELLEALAKESPLPMKVISQENSANIGKNFNIGLKEARGEYIMFIALDDVLTKNAISTKLEIMAKNPHIACVFSENIIQLDHQTKKEDVINLCSGLSNLPKLTGEILLEYEYHALGTFFIQGALFRHNIIREINGFDEDMLGDDIVLRCKLFYFLLRNPEYECKMLNEPSCYYRLHDSNINKNVIRQIKIVAEVLERFFPGNPAPKEFNDWLEYAINNRSFMEVLELFGYNFVISQKLKEERIRILLEISCIKNAMHEKE